MVGGGRYDNLVEQLGGPATPAIGFAFGIERLVLLLGERGKADQPRVFVAALGAEARRWAMRTTEALRAMGAAAELEYEPKSFKAQLKRADKIGAKLVLVVGDNELAGGYAQLKDMTAGGQRQIALQDVVAATLTALNASQ